MVNWPFNCEYTGFIKRLHVDKGLWASCIVHILPVYFVHTCSILNIFTGGQIRIISSLTDTEISSLRTFHFSQHKHN